MEKETLYEYRAWPVHAGPLIDAIHNSFPFLGMEARTDDYVLPVQMKCDFYLPKIRSGTKFEIKRRLSGLGLMEIWQREVSQVFPLDPELLPLLEEMYPGAPVSRTAMGTPAHLVSALSSHSFVCRVEKTRLLYQAGPCKAEITRISLYERNALTIALESSEPGPVSDFLDNLDAPLPPNLDYGAWLRAQLRNRAAFSIVRDGR